MKTKEKLHWADHHGKITEVKAYDPESPLLREALIDTLADDNYEAHAYLLRDASTEKGYDVHDIRVFIKKIGDQQ